MLTMKQRVHYYPKDRARFHIEYEYGTGETPEAIISALEVQLKDNLDEKVRDKSKQIAAVIACALGVINAQQFLLLPKSYRSVEPIELDFFA